MMVRFIGKLLDLYFQNVRDVQYGIDTSVGDIDMGLFNYTMYNFFSSRVVHGRRVTTIFKGYERRSNSWFKHK